MNTFDITVPNLNELYNRYPTGWFFAVYVKEDSSSVTYSSSTENVTMNSRNEVKRKRKSEEKDYPLRSKFVKKQNMKDYYQRNIDKYEKHNKEYYEKKQRKNQGKL